MWSSNLSGLQKTKVCFCCNLFKVRPYFGVILLDYGYKNLAALIYTRWGDKGLAALPHKLIHRFLLSLFSGVFDVNKRFTHSPTASSKCSTAQNYSSREIRMRVWSLKSRVLYEATLNVTH